MPRKKSQKRISISDHEALIFFMLALSLVLFIFHMEIVVYITVAAFVIETIWLIIRKFQNRPLTKQQVRRLDMYLRGLFVLLSVVWVTGVQAIFGIIAGIIVAVVVVWQVMKRQRRKVITSDIDETLRRALQIMDSTAKWYGNEDEANRELVTCLKSLNVDATYGYKLPNGRTADARVGGVLIEGKLSPDTTEVDRLIGQLSDYTQYGNRVNVVIYGQLDKEARRRIENEIQSRYLNRVFLTYLNSPRRLRAQVLP
jgi:hypothetical protein